MQVLLHRRGDRRDRLFSRWVRGGSDAFGLGGVGGLRGEAQGRVAGREEPALASFKS